MSAAGEKRPKASPAARRPGGGFARRALALVFPRRCPFCDEILAGPPPCGRCAAELKPYLHRPPLLAPTEFPYLGQVRAAAAYHYAGPVPGAILRAKQYGRPWYARELADLMAVRLFGAQWTGSDLAPVCDALPAGMRLCDGIVPVPSRRGGVSLPALLAGRLGVILDAPVWPDALEFTRRTAAQKSLSLAGRYQNQKGAYRLSAAGVRALEGRRVLLVDDTITTGATVAACAQALLQGGAYSVLAVSIAADDTPPKSMQISGEQQ